MREINHLLLYFLGTNVRMIVFIDQATEADRSPLSSDRNDEITEEMMQEMDYSADRAWYAILISCFVI